MNKQMKQIRSTCALLIASALYLTPVALSAEDSVKVTADTYVRAETDYQFKTYVDKLGSFGKFFHNRKPYDVNNQTTVRANRDTLYSFGVFDLNSPVTITLPEPKGRYQCLMPISFRMWLSSSRMTREHLKFRIGTRKGLRPCEQPSTCSPPPFLTHHPSLVKKMS